MRARYAGFCTTTFSQCPNCGSCDVHQWWVGDDLLLECRCGASWWMLEGNPGEQESPEVTPPAPPALLYAWKFWVPMWTADPEREGVEWRNCMAASIAATEEEARDVIRVHAAERGYDVGWLPVARVARLEITPRTFINIVMF